MIIEVAAAAGQNESLFQNNLGLLVIVGVIYYYGILKNYHYHYAKEST